MAKRVLVALDLDSLASWAAYYGMHLAARLNSPMALMVVASQCGESPGAPLALDGLKEEQRFWLDQVMGRCQREGVSTEIFLSCGSFFEEIIRFVSSPAAAQFLVIGVPRDSLKKDYRIWLPALERLHQAFPGEILLVREKGGVSRLAEYQRQNPGRET
jgi:hypothetical protein